MNRRSFIGTITAATAGIVTIATSEEVRLFGAKVNVAPIPDNQFAFGYEEVYRANGKILGYITDIACELEECGVYEDNYRKYIMPSKVFIYTVKGHRND